MAGEVVCGIIEPGRQPCIAADVMKTCLVQQCIPGKIPVIYKQIPANTPTCKLFPAFWEMTPIRLGPMEPPKSPASAKNANIAVPPYGIVFAARLKEPGQSIPTEKPQIAHPKRPIIGLSDKAATK